MASSTTRQKGRKKETRHFVTQLLPVADSCIVCQKKKKKKQKRRVKCTIVILNRFRCICNNNSIYMCIKF